VSGAIDTFLADLARRLAASPPERDALIEEARSHLEEASAQRRAQGATEEAAEEQAVAAFGAPNVVAARLNAVHGVDWDRRRMLWGMLVGALCNWVLWTLFTYPLLVQLAAQSALTGDDTNPAALLFSATPLSFGLFKVMEHDGLWVIALFLLLVAIVPFIWGRRARQPWRPGLAYGLGVIVGMPWLLPAIPYQMQWSAGSPASLLLIVGAVWALAPYAALASWVGSRSARFATSRALRRSPRPRRIVAAGASATRAPRSRFARLALPAVALLVLLAANAASFTRASALAAQSQPSIADQLAAAQTAVHFTIRLPGYLPDGVTLVSVSVAQAYCGKCAVSLLYAGPHGAQLSIGEMPSGDPNAFMAPPPAPDYRVSDVTAGGHKPIWWLGSEDTTEHQINLVWSDHGIDFFLGSNGHWPVDTLKQVAGSL
jgi:HAAS domain-containing protein